MNKMFKQILIATVLTLLLAEHSWDVEAHERTHAFDSQPQIHVNVRVKRFSNPFTFIANVWNALTDIYSIYAEQKNETNYALEETYDFIADGFNDTYLSTIRPTTTTESLKGLDPTPTTEKYRVYRKELGYMLGRNYRGLKKLFNIELQDALNQSKYNIEEYRREKAYALYPFTVKKRFDPPKRNKTSNNVRK